VQAAMGIFLMDRKSVHQPHEFTVFDLHDFGFRPGPSEAIFLKTLVPEAESIPVPVQDLHHVPPAIAENEQVAGKGIYIHMLFHHDGQTVYGFSHVGVPERQIHFQFRSWEEHHTPLSVRISFSRVSGLKSSPIAIVNRLSTTSRMEFGDGFCGRNACRVSTGTNVTDDSCFSTLFFQ